MWKFVTTTIYRAGLAAFVLASVAACTASNPSGQTGTSLSAYRGWIDSTLVPPGADRDDLLISNDPDHGG
jgi:hypothetical protein